MTRRSSPTASRARFRKLLAAGEILVAPGAYDAITARVIELHGFPAVYVTGSGTVNAQLGLPDIGLMTMAEMAQIVGHIAETVDVPVFSDADTGYGNELNVARTVRAFEQAGAVGAHIEDQEALKRCGHLEGKTIVPVDEMVAKLRAAVSARLDRDFAIIARTDAAAVEGLEGALARSYAYADAGADVIFCEALTTPEEFTRFAAEAPALPLLANMTEFGKTPLITTAAFEQMGYAAVIFPMTAFRLMLRAIDDGMGVLARTGTQRDLLADMHTRARLYEMLGYEPARPLSVLERPSGQSEE